MRKALVFLSMVVLAATGCLVAQPVPARTQVIPYYDETAIAKEAYRDSPYYMELADGWHRSATDSSIIYERQLEAEKDWRDFRIYLNVRATYGVRVTLNGFDLGAGGDSRHWNEFLLDPALRYGRTNVLTVEALTRPREALLEATPRPLGVNGNPFLLFKNDPNVNDYTLTADYDAASGSGTLTLAADLYCGKRKGKYYLEVELWDPKGHSFDRMGRWVVFNGRSEESVELSRSWSGVEPWNAESPTLYTAVIRLRNEDMQEEEMLGTHFGFRRVEVKEGQLLLNGRPVTLKGVTYGFFATDDAAARERMRADVETMKRNNINAVRTSRFSPLDPYFYELCDRYGLYVVCDANLMPLSEQHRVAATEQDLMPLFERRVENLYGRYKNHTSIIGWSLGDSRDNGVCMTAAYKRLKAKEKTRPVLFSGASFSESTDLIAPILPTTESLGQMLRKQGPRPYLMLAAVDSATFPRLGTLWQMVENNRQLQGGFVDVWPIDDARLVELKHLFSPFDARLVKVMPDEGEFAVYNRFDFSTFANYIVEYNIYTNLRSHITGGDLAVALQPHSTDHVTMRIPNLALQAGEEAFIRFDLSPRRPSAVTPKADYVVFPLPQHAARRSALVNQGSRLPADSLLPAPYTPRFLEHPDWSVEELAVAVTQPDANTRCRHRMLRYSEGGVPQCDLRQTDTYFATGDHLIELSFAPDERVRGSLTPQLVLPLPAGDDTIAWFGLDRQVFFAERHAALTGIFALPFNQLKNGDSRREVRWLTAGQLFVQMPDATFTFAREAEGVTVTPMGDRREVAVHLHALTSGSPSPSTLHATVLPRVDAGILEPPVISADEVRFSAPLTIRIASSQPGEIRYTLDGSEPDAGSPRYTGPFTIDATTVVKARLFAAGMPPSFTATRRFNYDYIVRTTFSRKASTPYNVGADTILFDAEKGTVDQLDRGWVGFSGEAVVTTVQLAKRLAVESLTVRYAHAPATWAFAPQRVKVALSTDGVSYIDTLVVDIPFDPSDEARQEPTVVELRIPVGREAGYIQIIPQTLRAIPAWHRAKGLKPWLMMDEIEVVEGIAKP